MVFGTPRGRHPRPPPPPPPQSPPKTRGVHARTHGRTNAINSPFGNGAKQTKSYFLLLFVILNVYFRNPNSCAPASIYPRRGRGETFLPVPFRSLPPSDALAGSSGFKVQYCTSTGAPARPSSEGFYCTALYRTVPARGFLPGVHGGEEVDVEEEDGTAEKCAQRHAACKTTWPIT